MYFRPSLWSYFAFDCGVLGGKLYRVDLPDRTLLIFRTGMTLLAFTTLYTADF